MKHLTTTFRACAIFLAIGSSTTAAVAATDPGHYELAAIVDEAHGEELVAGKFDAAIANLAGHKAGRVGGFAVKNNLCVAYALAREIDLATRACDAALKIAHRNVRRANSSLAGSERRDKAIALSNRGVVLALGGNVDAAQKDFEAAIRMRAHLRAPANNSKHLATVAVNKIARR